uniref:partner and localizer of BRCA2-like n=1 Tax=Myxine glutinosa TaxID=7769 RepID=UPI00358E63ED
MAQKDASAKKRRVYSEVLSTCKGKAHSSEAQQPTLVAFPRKEVDSEAVNVAKSVSCTPFVHSIVRGQIGGASCEILSDKNYVLSNITDLTTAVKLEETAKEMSSCQPDQDALVTRPLGNLETDKKDERTLPGSIDVGKTYLKPGFESCESDSNFSSPLVAGKPLNVHRDCVTDTEVYCESFCRKSKLCRRRKKGCQKREKAHGTTPTWAGLQVDECQESSKSQGEHEEPRPPLCAAVEVEGHRRELVSTQSDTLTKCLDGMDVEHPDVLPRTSLENQLTTKECIESAMDTSTRNEQRNAKNEEASMLSDEICRGVPEDPQNLEELSYSFGLAVSCLQTCAWAHDVQDFVLPDNLLTEEKRSGEETVDAKVDSDQHSCELTRWQQLPHLSPVLMIQSVQNWKVRAMCSCFWEVDRHLMSCLAIAQDHRVTLWVYCTESTKWEERNVWEISNDLEIKELIPLKDSRHVMILAVSEILSVLWVQRSSANHRVLLDGLPVGPVAAIPGCRVACFLDVQEGACVSVLTLAPDGRNVSEVILEDPDSPIISLSYVLGQNEALVATTQDLRLLVWCILSGHVILTVPLDFLTDPALCKEAYSESGMLLVLLLHRPGVMGDPCSTCLWTFAAVNPITACHFVIQECVVSSLHKERCVREASQANLLAGELHCGTVVLWDVPSGQALAACSALQPVSWTALAWIESMLLLGAKDGSVHSVQYSCTSQACV